MQPIPEVHRRHEQLSRSSNAPLSLRDRLAVVLCAVTLTLIMLMLMALAPSRANAQEIAPNSDVHIHIMTLREAEQPRIIGDYLILSYDRERPLRYVGAAFEHEDFAERHIFRRNPHDVFVLAYELPTHIVGDEQALTEIEYRLVADGTWTTDPNAPETRRIATDFRVSVASLSERPKRRPAGPRRLADGRVEFLFEDAPGRRVFVAGSFTNWDPYLHRMEEIEPGTYRIRLPLREDTHYYHFVSNGRRYTDPRNTGVTYERAGRSVSRFDG